ncbi:MAG TPA: hypothetical protein VGV13_18020 [Methylomirabilota bacterium]|jgi:hypothetical protein|nr:hypothetical protein [Methylomirabilota bacterium]
MTRLLATVEMVLLNDTLMGWVDTLLLCLGLTLTAASAIPALQSLRGSREERA